jgi:hypothetical protein
VEQERAGADIELASAREQPSTRVLALRLSLLLHAHCADLSGFASDLAGLHAAEADLPVHHVAWWRLLNRDGRGAEAAALALRYAAPPVSAAEVRCLAEAFLELGLAEHARLFLERFVPDLGVTSDVWALSADVLHRERDWQGLRALALEIRSSPFVRQSLAGYSYYVEGLARLGGGSPEAARLLFTKIAEFPLRDHDLALGVGANLGALGFPSEAREMLLSYESELGGRRAYWTQLIALAWQLRDGELLLRAARRGYQLAPEDVSSQQPFATALLLHRREPELALYLTGRVIDAEPRQPAAILNRALALLLDHRPDEAGALLESTDLPSTDGPGSMMLLWARLELHAARDERDAVRELLPQLPVSHLFPAQRQRLHELRAGIEPGNAPR